MIREFDKQPDDGDSPSAAGPVVGVVFVLIAIGIAIFAGLWIRR
jgi:hypothetical protein